MKIGAVVAEYNPFHNGHAYQLQEFRKACDLDFCIVVMSGSFVQRGEPAICDKYTRTFWALSGGADMVIELPVYYSLGNASVFARGAVGTVMSVADVLGFGSEICDTELLTRASCIDTAAISDTVSGKNFPRVVGEVLKEEYGDDVSEVYSNPNATLAVEYIRAKNELCPQMGIHITERKGVSHDSNQTDGEFSSASHLRSMIARGESIERFVPDFVRLEKHLTLDDLDKLILYNLRNISHADLENIADVSEGLHNLIKKAALTCTCYNDLLHTVKSKRYTMARLKRICLCALLGITHDMHKSPAQYIHVLGIRENSRNALLSEMQKRSRLPIFTKGKDFKKYTEVDVSLSRVDVLATDTYALFYNEFPNSDYSNKLLIF